MPARDSVKVMSRSKRWIKHSLRNIERALAGGNLKLLERERRFLNALGLNVTAQITSAVEGEILSRLEQQEQAEALQAAAEQAADRLTLSEIDRIKGQIDKLKGLRRRRQIKLGDRAIREIASDPRFGKVRTLSEFTEESMELARSARPQAWVWTANASACAACLSRHGSRFEGNFSPLHPNCLCIAETPGLSRPLTDDEIGDQMIARGGRDARLGRALKAGEVSRDSMFVRIPGGLKQRTANIPLVAGPTARYRNADFLDRVDASPVEDFYSGFAQARQGKYGAFLSDFDQTHFDSDNIVTYTAFDGKVGAALTDHGDGRIEIGSLFASPDAPDGAGRDMLRYLVRERDANYLTNFDGPLTEFYKAEGFEIVSRSPFNPEFAPANWNTELFGTPDFVEMAKK